MATLATQTSKVQRPARQRSPRMSKSFLAAIKELCPVALHIPPLKKQRGLETWVVVKLGLASGPSLNIGKRVLSLCRFIQRVGLSADCQNTLWFRLYSIARHSFKGTA